MIDGQSRSASAEAISSAEVVTLPAGEVRAALRADPSLLMAAAVGLAATVRRLTGGTADLVFLDLPRRLAKLLVAEAREEAAGRPRVDTGMSQSALVDRLGVTRQSLNRALAGLAHRGLSYLPRDPVKAKGIEDPVRVVDDNALRSAQGGHGQTFSYSPTPPSPNRTISGREPGMR
jgi:hypothetical protein